MYWGFCNFLFSTFRLIRENKTTFMSQGIIKSLPLQVRWPHCVPSKCTFMYTIVLCIMCTISVQSVGNRFLSGVEAVGIGEDLP